MGRKALLAAAIVIAASLVFAGEEKTLPGKKTVSDADLLAAVGDLGADKARLRVKAYDLLVSEGARAIEPLKELFRKPGKKAEKKIIPVEPEVLDPLVRDLGSDNFRKREAASRKIIALGLPAKEAVEKLLDADDPEVRRRAADIISGIDEQEKEREAEEQKAQSTLFLRKYMAMLVLSHLRDKAALDVLVGALGEKEELLYITALTALHRATGTSLGFTLDDLSANRGHVQEKWAEAVDKELKCEGKVPEGPLGGEAIVFKEVWAEDESSVVTRRCYYMTHSRPTALAVEQARQNAKKKAVAQPNRPGLGLRAGSTSSRYTADIKYYAVFESVYRDTALKIAEGLPSEFEREIKSYDIKNWQQQFVNGKPGEKRALNRGKTGGTFKGTVLGFSRDGRSWNVLAKSGEVALHDLDVLSRRVGCERLMLPPGKVKPGDRWTVSRLAAYRFIKSFFSLSASDVVFDNASAELVYTGSALCRGKKCARILMNWEIDVPASAYGARGRGAYSYTGGVSFQGKMFLTGELYFDTDAGKIVLIDLFGAGYYSPEATDNSRAYRMGREVIEVKRFYFSRINTEEETESGEEKEENNKQEFR